MISVVYPNDAGSSCYVNYVGLPAVLHRQESDKRCTLEYLL